MVYLYDDEKSARSWVLQTAQAFLRGAASGQEARPRKVQQKSSSRTVLDELDTIINKIMDI